MSTDPLTAPAGPVIAIRELAFRWETGAPVAGVVVGLFGMLTALLTSLNERRPELAILRSVGARPANQTVYVRLPPQLAVHGRLRCGMNERLPKGIYPCQPAS